ncbi:MAG: TIGR00645 family protein [Burkholderiaceae bacterium]
MSVSARPPRRSSSSRRFVSRTIFLSRWLQLPLYVGLIVAQGVYVWQFWVELVHLLSATFGDMHAVQTVTCAVQAASVDCSKLPEATGLSEATVMLVVLALVDVVMISNLLIMVIIGGYETFVSRLDLEDHHDSPEWLSHVNASVLKVKLGTAIIGISSIHLLKTFINASQYDAKTLIGQTGIHLAFLLSAIAIGYAERIVYNDAKSDNDH